ncbi:MAG: hypothetical protein U9Q83_07530, partial [Bacteroidota bacterium]|nr:hypothetical protein [Bacteroidota bacterium]
YNVAINPLIDFKYYKFPFNEESINLMPWHWREAAIDDINKVNGATGRNLKELVINFYGSTIYDIFYKNYIKKLTGLEADNIDQVQFFRKNLHAIDKIVNFYNEDCYFPLDEGWNKLFYSLTEGVEVKFNSEVNYNNFNERDLIVLTTRPDIFFNKQAIPYIGVEFDIDSVNYDKNKPDTIIYPNHVPFISMTQYGKLFSPGKQIEEKNMIVKEFMGINKGEDAFPVPMSTNIQCYNNIIEEYKHIYYCGPLAKYTHMSMAEAMENAQQIAAEIKHKER